MHYNRFVHKKKENKMENKINKDDLAIEVKNKIEEMAFEETIMNILTFERNGVTGNGNTLDDLLVEYDDYREEYDNNCKLEDYLRVRNIIDGDSFDLEYKVVTKEYLKKYEESKNEK